MRRTRVVVLCFAAFLFAGAFRVWPVAAQAPAPYLNPDLDFESRARDLVSRMSVEEKVSQLTNQAAEIPRLGVPAYEWWNECLHGVARAGVATVFPQAIGLAATFDEPLMHEMASVIADEARAKHHQFVRQGRRGAPFDEAVSAARASDVVVFVGGLTAEVEGEEMKVAYPGFAGGDRTDIELPAVQKKMLEALHATGKPVVLVLTTGSALGVSWAQEHLPAIVLAWYPGQQGGNAVADVPRAATSGCGPG